MTFVHWFTFTFFLYMFSLLSFLQNYSEDVDENPANWWLPALIFYSGVNILCNCTLRYIHSCLASKLKRIQNGVVLNSSAVSSTTASENEKA